jgi:hypothetical protein
LHKLIELTFCTMLFNPWTKFTLWLHQQLFQKSFKKLTNVYIE